MPRYLAGFPVERRRSHREAVVAIGRLTAADELDPLRPVQVLVTDLSLHGCDLRCAVEPRDGSFYHIDLSVGPLTLNSRLRVIRILGRSDGTFEVGGEFV